MALDLPTLKTDIADYMAEHAKATAVRSNSAERMKIVRAALETNTDHVSSAKTFIDEFQEKLQDFTDEKPEILPALFALVKGQLLTFLKEERDNFILGFNGKNLSAKAESFDRKKLEELENRINLLYSTLESFGVDVSEIPVTVSEKTGKKSIIPKIPRAENKTATDAITKKIVWTVDGKTFRGYTIPAMRKVLCEDREIRPSVADLRSLLDSATTTEDGKKMFVYRSQIVTYHAESLTPEEIEELDEIENDELETESALND